MSGIKSKTMSAKLRISITLLFSLLFFGVVGLVGLTTQAQEKPERVIVMFEQAVDESARQVVEASGGHIIADLNLINGLVVLLPEQAREKVVAVSGVVSIEPDVQVFALHHRPGHGGGPGSGGEDPSQPAQEVDWGVERVGAPEAWDTNIGAGVKIAIVDTGIQLNHPDLVVVRAADCTRGPSCDRGGSGDDDNGHGTHVAGTASALNNDIGVVGVAHSADLYAVKVLRADGSGFLSDVIKGIEWSMKNGQIS